MILQPQPQELNEPSPFIDIPNTALIMLVNEFMTNIRIFSTITKPIR